MVSVKLLFRHNLFLHRCCQTSNYISAVMIIFNNEFHIKHSMPTHPFPRILYLVSACRSGAWSPVAGLSGAALHNRRLPSLLVWPSAPRTDSSPLLEDAGSSWHQPYIVPALAARGVAGSPCLSAPRTVMPKKET